MWITSTGISVSLRINSHQMVMEPYTHSADKIICHCVQHKLRYIHFHNWVWSLSKQEVTFFIAAAL